MYCMPKKRQNTQYTELKIDLSKDSTWYEAT